MSGFNFMRDGGATLLAGVNNDAFREGVQQRQVDQDNQLKREQAVYENDRQRTYHTKLAEAMTANDPDRAAMLAYQYGDEKTGTGIGKVRQEQFTRAQGSNTSYANIVAGVAERPYAERRAALLSAAPMLTRMGISPAEIEAFDPTDQNIAALAGVDYTAKDRDANDVAVYGANTNRMDAQTKRMELSQPKVVGQNQSLVTPEGGELFRAPQYQSFGLDENVYVDPGTTSQGYTSNITSGARGGDATWGAMIGAESGGRQLDGQGRPLRSSAGAIGIAQVMPATAREVAGQMGIAWDEQRYRTDPAYNEALGRHYYDSMVKRFGGDIPKAVAAYNAGPAGVDRAMARAARSGGSWTQYLPAETQAYVQKVTRNSQVQGQRQTRPTPQLLQRGVPKPARGSSATDGGKPVPAKWADKFMDARNVYLGFDRAEKSFKPGFGGNVAGSAENLIQGVVGDRFGTPGQRDWWANHFSNDNKERHEIFGAALTGTEKAAWEATTISPSMSDEQIMRNLQRRREIVANKLKYQRRFLVAQGYSQTAIAALAEGL
ncbi:transglycosylase SLT domain-containing protein [Sphingomonas sp. S1-29]|uniref:transglycosylase SLT domain-containing protein n=1 Tax=Sphingomonas sp. S1-29 TaxID=2991074 RepID=UPI0022401953|nr:transglycosylase SLT domain-containing protein [Sphingomonas sp. S1-29]UZK70754.1 transglycosylase SLT domain-containing protein [Sphingomonas sp. S1-29]